jgi:hypothetical protein
MAASRKLRGIGFRKQLCDRETAFKIGAQDVCPPPIQQSNPVASAESNRFKHLHIWAISELRRIEAARLIPAQLRPGHLAARSIQALLWPGMASARDYPVAHFMLSINDKNILQYGLRLS